MHEKRKNRPRRWLLFLLAAAVLIGALLADSNFRIVTTEYVISGENLPAAFDGFRIVQLSDIHAAEYGPDNARLVRAVRQAAPDLIAVTGDLIDAEGQLDMVETLVTQLTGIAPVCFINGNHEWDSGDISQLHALLRRCGVTILQNAWLSLERDGSAIALAGIEDPNGPADMPRPSQVFQEMRAELGDLYTVVLYHRNNRLALFSELGADVVLSGHAHGGMIRLPFTDGLIDASRRWFPTYTSGVYTQGSTSMVVSRGLGNHTGFPRLLNNPHIPVIVLRSA